MLAESTSEIGRTSPTRPGAVPVCLNCADCYTEEEFKDTEMYEKGNCYGTRCHERIVVTLAREVLTQKESGV